MPGTRRVRTFAGGCSSTRPASCQANKVLVSMGEFWTLLSADDFRALAERILRQL
jgi:hypothetical protein